MEIYHEAQSFLKTFLVFKNKHAQWTGSKKYTPLAQNIDFKFEKYQTQNLT